MQSYILIAVVLLGSSGIAGADTLRATERIVDTAKTLRLKGDYLGAEKKLSEVLAEQPDHFRATYNLGLAYSQAGKTDLAISTLERAATLRQKSNASDYTIYNSLGWLHMSNGDYGEAEKQFLIGMEHKDGLSKTSRGLLANNLGTLYLSQGKIVQAKPLFQEALEAGYTPAKLNLDVAKLLEQINAAPTPSTKGNSASVNLGSKN